MIVELEKLTIRCLLERTFELYGSLPSIATVEEQPVVYLQLKQQIQDAAGALVARGIKKGDRVAIMGENCPNWVIAYLAVTSMGAVAVPVLTGFPDTDTRHILRNSEAQGIFIEPKQRGKLEGMDDSTLKFICDLENMGFEDRQKPHVGFIGKTLALFKRGRTKNAADAEAQIDVPEPEAEDLAVIIYTSGTTGHSKGVMLSHRNIVFDVVNGIERFPINANDRFLSILPLAHTFEATGGMLCPIAIGASIYYMRGLPTPQKLLAAMETVKPTAVLTVPLVIDKIFRKKILPQIQSKLIINKLYPLAFFRKKLHQVAGRKLIQSFGNKLRFFMFGGASLNEDVEIFLRDAGISYSTGYGMTETAPIMTINPFGQVKVGSCGKPIPGIEMSIHEPDTQNGIGEIIVRGPIVMSGYYKNPDATRRCLSERRLAENRRSGIFRCRRLPVHQGPLQERHHRPFRRKHLSRSHRAEDPAGTLFPGSRRLRGQRQAAGQGLPGLRRPGPRIRTQQAQRRRSPQTDRRHPGAGAAAHQHPVAGFFADQQDPRTPRTVRKNSDQQGQALSLPHAQQIGIDPGHVAGKYFLPDQGRRSPDRRPLRPDQP